MVSIKLDDSEKHAIEATYDARDDMYLFAAASILKLAKFLHLSHIISTAEAHTIGGFVVQKSLVGNLLQLVNWGCECFVLAHANANEITSYLENMHTNAKDIITWLKNPDPTDIDFLTSMVQEYSKRAENCATLVNAVTAKFENMLQLEKDIKDNFAEALAVSTDIGESLENEIEELTRVVASWKSLSTAYTDIYKVQVSSMLTIIATFHSTPVDKWETQLIADKVVDVSIKNTAMLVGANAYLQITDSLEKHINTITYMLLDGILDATEYKQFTEECAADKTFLDETMHSFKASLWDEITTKVNELDE